LELRSLHLVNQLPKMAVIQAEGANPLYTAFLTNSELVPASKAQTVATAIQIGNPVSWKKSLRGIRATGGVVEQVSDQEILDAKAQVDAAGIGAEPASCATVAGTKKLVARGIIKDHEQVCGILTGHLLKDPNVVVDYHRGVIPNMESKFANPPLSIPATMDAVLAAVRGKASDVKSGPS
jgi:threonine synthase